VDGEGVAVGLLPGGPPAAAVGWGLEEKDEGCGVGAQWPGNRVTLFSVIVATASGRVEGGGEGAGERLGKGAAVGTDGEDDGGGEDVEEEEGLSESVSTSTHSWRHCSTLSCARSFKTPTTATATPSPPPVSLPLSLSFAAAVAAAAAVPGTVNTSMPPL